MSHDCAPAIARAWQQEDSNADVMLTVRNAVTRQRGMGDSGRRVEGVAHECPACSFDRMVRLTRVLPEERDQVRYWCLNPACPHFVGDQLSHHRSHVPVPSEPRVHDWEEA